MSMSGPATPAIGAGTRFPAIRLYNHVLALLVVVAAVAVATTAFIAVAPNRLVSGRPVAIWLAADPRLGAAIALFGAALLGTAFAPPRRALHYATAIMSALLFLLILAAAGQAAAMLAGSAPGLARISLGAAFWVLLGAAGLAVLDGLQCARAGVVAQLAMAVVIAAGFAAMAEAGIFDALSLAREYHIRQAGFAGAVTRHIVLVAAAIGPAVLIGFPLGVAAVRRPGWQDSLFAVLNLLQTIPSIAQFGLSAGLAEMLLNDYRAGFPGACVLFPDAVQTLSSLRASGMKLGLITNGSALYLEVRIALCRTERGPGAVFSDPVAPQFHSGRDRFIGNVIQPRTR